MDDYRDFPSEFELGASEETPPPSDAAPAIGVDERRMHVRAYNYWVSLLDGRDFPSIEDLEPTDVEDFGPHSVLVDFTGGPTIRPFPSSARRSRTNRHAEDDQYRSPTFPAVRCCRA